MRFSSINRPTLPYGFFLTDEVRTPDPVAVARTLPSGTGVIFRHYDAADRWQTGCELRDICRSLGQVFLVAGLIDGATEMARALEADGIHLPERDLMLAPPDHLPGHWIVTAAAHSRSAVRRAKLVGVDAVLVSPVFKTASHPEAGAGEAALGVHRLARITEGARPDLAIYALGGINMENIRKLPPGVDGVAAIGLFL